MPSHTEGTCLPTTSSNIGELETDRNESSRVRPVGSNRSRMPRSRQNLLPLLVTRTTSHLHIRKRQVMNTFSETSGDINT